MISFLLKDMMFRQMVFLQSCVNLLLIFTLGDYDERFKMSYVCNLGIHVLKCLFLNVQQCKVNSMGITPVPALQQVESRT